VDLASANYNANDITVWFGDGKGSFHGRQDFGAGFEPSSLVLADLDGDGAPDLAAANASFGMDWAAAVPTPRRATRKLTVLRNRGWKHDADDTGGATPP